MSKQWPEKIDVFMSKEMKDAVVEWCKRTRVPLTEAGRVAFQQFLDKYKNFDRGQDFP